MKSTILIYFCVNIDGQRTYKATGYKVERKHWDSNKELRKSTHKIAAHINADLTIKKNNILKRLINDQVNGKVRSIASVEKSIQPGDSTNFFQYVERWVPTARNKRTEGTLKNYKYRR